MALQQFDFDVIFCKADDNEVADCFSRLVAMQQDEMLPLSLEEIKNYQKFDNESKVIMQILESNNFPHKKPIDVSDKLWSMRKSLLLKDEFLYNSENLLYVPYKMRLKVLTVGHGLHHGIVGTLNNIRSCCFWPGMRTDVKKFVKQCRICSLVKPKKTVG